jgi:hypothetical protein
MPHAPRQRHCVACDMIGPLAARSRKTRKQLRSGWDDDSSDEDLRRYLKGNATARTDSATNRSENVNQSQESDDSLVEILRARPARCEDVSVHDTSTMIDHAILQLTSPEVIECMPSKVHMRTNGPRQLQSGRLYLKTLSMPSSSVKSPSPSRHDQSTNQVNALSSGPCDSDDNSDVSISPSCQLRGRLSPPSALVHLQHTSSETKPQKRRAHVFFSPSTDSDSN